MSTASNWIGVQTGVHGFDSRTPHKHVVSKTSEADIWLGSYNHLTDVRGQGGGCQQLSQPKGSSLSGKYFEQIFWNHFDPEGDGNSNKNQNRKILF